MTDREFYWAWFKHLLREIFTLSKKKEATMTYEGHYPGCTSHPDHKGDCTVTRNLPKETVGKIQLGMHNETLTQLHTCEMTMHMVASELATLARDHDAQMQHFLCGDSLPKIVYSIPDRMRALAARLMLK